MEEEKGRIHRRVLPIDRPLVVVWKGGVRLFDSSAVPHSLPSLVTLWPANALWQCWPRGVCWHRNKMKR